jgi:hypothetical protein
MFTAALSTTAGLWTQPSCSRADERIKEVWLTPVIPAPQEAEIRKMQFEASLGK